MPACDSSHLGGDVRGPKQLSFPDPGQCITSWITISPAAIDCRCVDIGEHSQRQKLGTVHLPEDHFSSTAPSGQWGETSILDTRQRKAAGAKASRSVKQEAPIPSNKRQKEQCSKSRPTYLRSCKVDDELFCVGDSAYALEEGQTYKDFRDERELCEVCGRIEHRCKARGKLKSPLLECDKCLRAFHADCCEPPLKAIPQGEWHCADCVAGRPAASRHAPRDPRTQFMASQLSLVRIDRMRRLQDGTVRFSGRWYCKPGDTVVGRQEHHTARDVFLTELLVEDELDCLVRPVTVCPQSELDQHTEGDVFVCDHQYHTGCAVFRELGAADEDSAHDALYLSDASQSDADEPAFSPSQTTGKARASQRRRLQGGDEWETGRRKQIVALGATECPAARQAARLTPLEAARAALALTAAPKSMPCREQERSEITRFVEEAVAAGEDCLGQCLYVAGVPGTGKTATLHEVIRQMRARVEADESAPFRYIEINALRLASPQHAYVQLYRALTGKHASPAAAAEHLERMFAEDGKAESKRVTVLLVDEMDLLITKKQQVLYNLCEWPSRKGSRLAVIGIANTLDLPERLMPRIASRLGSRRVVFQPYKREQLQAIVSQRLLDAGVAKAFEENAIKYAASKVAAVSGDVRRALELCRKAAEIAEDRCCSSAAPASSSGAERGRQGVVTMAHVDLAVTEMFRAVHMQLLGNACRLEKILLAALVIETRATGRQDAVLSRVHERLRYMCEARQEAVPHIGDVVSAAARLGAKRLVLCDPAALRLRMQLALNVDTDDVIHKLRDDETMAWMKQLNL